MGEIKIIRHEIKPLPEGFHSRIFREDSGFDGSDPMGPIREEMNDWFQPEIRVFTAIPPEQLFHRTVSFPFSQPRRISQLIRFEAEGHLPFSLQDHLIEHFPSEYHGKKTDVMAWIIEREKLRKMLDRFQAMGLDPAGIGVEGLCLLHLSLACANGLPACHAYLDLGAKRSLFLVINHGRPVLLRSLAFGGDDLTQALAEEFGVSVEQGEAGKLTEGRIRPDPSQEKEDQQRRIASCLDKAISPLITGIENTIRFIERHRLEEEFPRRIQEIILCGGSANLSGLDNTLSDNLDMPVRAYRIPETWMPEAEIPESEHPLLAEPLALALQDALPSRTGTVNFRKGEFAYRMESRSFRIKLILPALLLIMLILVSLMRVFVVKSRAEQEVEVIRSQMVQALKREIPNATVADPLKQVKQMLIETQNRAERYKDFTSASALKVLSVISENIPGDLWVEVSRFSYTESQARLEGETQGFQEAKSIVDSLASVPLFEKVVLEDTRTIKQGNVQFVIQISLKKEKINP